MDPTGGKPTVHSLIESIENAISRIEGQLYPSTSLSACDSEAQPTIEATIRRLQDVSAKLAQIEDELRGL